MSVTLDLMEYASNANAQAAYVSNDTTGFKFTSYEINNDDEQPIGAWNGNNYSTSQTFTLADASIIYSVDVLMGILFGSPTGTITVQIVTTSSGVPTSTLAHANFTKTFTPTASAWNTITFTNPGWVPAGQYAITLVTYQSGNNMWRWQSSAASPVYAGGKTYRSVDYGVNWYAQGADCLFKVNGVDLQCFSEATIKTQGSYSLLCGATTATINKTLTRTVSPTIDLTGQDVIKFDIYASRTGANIQISIHDSGGTTTSKTYTVLSANTWETVTWDISAVSNANKDAIDQIKITNLDATNSNVFFLDNMYATISSAIKTINGLVRASVQSINGLAIASVKTWNGLS